MAIQSEIIVYVKSRDNRDLPSTPAIITKVEWDKSERIKNAVRVFGITMGCAFASIFVHMFHLILVPTLFISSFVLASNKLEEKFRNEGGTGECPSCHQAFRVQPSKWSGRITNSCDHCPAELEMTLPT